MVSTMTRKGIDDILLSVGGDKLSQREWDYIKLLKPMKPDLQVVALGLFERRGDGDAIKRFNASETKI